MVNNTEALIAELSNDPTNLILSTMLVDALIEDRDMIATEAAAHVVRLQRAAWRGRQLRTATRRIARSDRNRMIVRDAIEEHYPILDNVDYTFVVVPGDQLPEVHYSDQRLRPGWWTAITVNVSADWCLRAIDRHS